MNMKRSIYDNPSPPHAGEHSEILSQSGNVTIERIVSSGSQSPTAYLQDHDEWVMLVRGEAEMTIDGKRFSIQAGDTLLLSANVPHEVLTTSANALWLAVHVR